MISVLLQVSRLASCKVEKFGGQIGWWVGGGREILSSVKQ